MGLEPVLVFYNENKFRRNLNMKDMFILSPKVILRGSFSFVAGEKNEPCLPSFLLVEILLGR